MTTFLFSLLFLLLIHHSSSAVGSSLSPSPSPSPNDSDFIRTSCGTTLYPRLCYASLSRYASAVRTNPASLAEAAISVSLASSKHMAVFVSNLSRRADYAADHRSAAALHDCFSNLDDAVDQIRDSLSQMKTVRSSQSGARSSVRFEMSNVQTWMSAALTDMESCTDGFDDVAAATEEEVKVKAEVVRRGERVKRVTSNALALVNSVAENLHD